MKDCGFLDKICSELGLKAVEDEGKVCWKSWNQGHEKQLFSIVYTALMISYRIF